MTDSDDDGGSLQHSFIYLQSRTNPVGRTANRVGRRTAHSPLILTLTVTVRVRVSDLQDYQSWIFVAHTTYAFLRQ